MSSVSSSSNSCHPPAGGIVGLSVDNQTLENAVSTAVPQLSSALAGLLASYLPKHEGVFDENDWNELWGRVAPAPPLPINIEEIWEGSCPIFPDKKVKDTHVLVYLPTTVGDEPLTLKTIDKIIRTYFFNRRDKGYQSIWKLGVKQMGNQCVTAAGWVLMTKTVIDGSGGESYGTQQNMIRELARKTGVAYTIPTGLEATICILTHYMRTNTRLFSDSPPTYTRCQKSKYRYLINVGGFHPTGLYVYNDTINHPSTGVAALRKF